MGQKHLEFEPLRKKERKSGESVDERGRVTTQHVDIRVWIRKSSG